MAHRWKKAACIAAIALAFAAGLTALILWVIVPAARYAKANALEKQGDAAGACDLFDRLEDYRDAAGRKEKLQAAAADTRTEQTMEFGGYNWLVLEQRDGKALLLLQDILEKRPFYETEDDSSTRTSWEASTLRTWLNGGFYRSFSQADRSRIAETTVRGSGNREYGVKAGKDTRDYVFLLSLEEAKLYFPDDAARIARVSGGNPAWWWLRSPGYEDHCAAVVTGEGGLGYPGSGVNYYDTGVRPALWVAMH